MKCKFICRRYYIINFKSTSFLRWDWYLGPFPPCITWTIGVIGRIYPLQIMTSLYNEFANFVYVCLWVLLPNKPNGSTYDNLVLVTTCTNATYIFVHRILLASLILWNLKKYVLSNLACSWKLLASHYTQIMIPEVLKINPVLNNHAFFWIFFIHYTCIKPYLKTFSFYRGLMSFSTKISIMLLPVTIHRNLTNVNPSSHLRVHLSSPLLVHLTVVHPLPLPLDPYLHQSQYVYILYL